MSESNQPIQPSEDSLDTFKTQVKSYIEIDDEIRTLKRSLAEKMVAKKELSGIIQEFMQTHNIEDLNTRHGTIRYKITRCKRPLSQSMIKTKLVESYDPHMTAVDLAKKIFEERAMYDRPCLRRLKQA